MKAQSPSSLYLTRGECTVCQIVFSWKAPPLLRDRSCPLCARPLRRTSYAFRYGRMWPPSGYRQIIV